LLKSDSKKTGTSLNNLINNILRRYISWEKYAVEIGFIPLTKETVKLLFNELDEASVKRIAKRLGGTIPRELILLMFSKVDFKNIISFLEITLSRYGMVHHLVNGENHDFVLRHNVSEKFSSFLAEVGRVMAEDLSIHYEVRVADSKILSVRIRAK
jgi:hypothetical protein